MSKQKKPPIVVKKSSKVIELIGSDAWHKAQQARRKKELEERRKRKLRATELKKKYEAQKPKKEFNVDEGPPARRDEKAAVNNYWQYLQIHFGMRLVPKRFGYWLDGSPIAFDTLMVLMNRDRKAQGMEQIGIDKNPAWKA